MYVAMRIYGLSWWYMVKWVHVAASTGAAYTLLRTAVEHLNNLEDRLMSDVNLDTFNTKAIAVSIRKGQQPQTITDATDTGAILSNVNIIQQAGRGADNVYADVAEVMPAAYLMAPTKEHEGVASKHTPETWNPLKRATMLCFVYEVPQEHAGKQPTPQRLAIYEHRDLLAYRIEQPFKGNWLSRQYDLEADKTGRTLSENCDPEYRRLAGNGELAKKEIEALFNKAKDDSTSRLAKAMEKMLKHDPVAQSWNMEQKAAATAKRAAANAKLDREKTDDLFTSVVDKLAKVKASEFGNQTSPETWTELKAWEKKGRKLIKSIAS